MRNTNVKQKDIFFDVIDRESPTTGVWVLDWVIRLINEISSIAREVDQGASSRL